MSTEGAFAHCRQGVSGDAYCALAQSNLLRSTLLTLLASGAQKMSSFSGILQSARNSINRNMEPFSEGLHKVVGGSAGTESGYESDSEASVAEVITCLVPHVACQAAVFLTMPPVSQHSHRGLTELLESPCPSGSRC